MLYSQIDSESISVCLFIVFLSVYCVSVCLFIVLLFVYCVSVCFYP